MSKRDRRLDRQRKEQERQLHVETVQIELPDIPFERLLESAIWHYNNDIRQEHQQPVDQSTDAETLDRLCVNYARHILCPGYDASYRHTLYRLSRDEAKKIARKTALAQIALKWPSLENECRRQYKEA